MSLLVVLVLKISFLFSGYRLMVRKFFNWLLPDMTLKSRLTFFCATIVYLFITLHFINNYKMILFLNNIYLLIVLFIFQKLEYGTWFIFDLKTNKYLVICILYLILINFLGIKLLANVPHHTLLVNIADTFIYFIIFSLLISIIINADKWITKIMSTIAEKNSDCTMNKMKVPLDQIKDIKSDGKFLIGYFTKSVFTPDIIQKLEEQGVDFSRNELSAGDVELICRELGVSFKGLKTRKIINQIEIQKNGHRKLKKGKYRTKDVVEALKSEMAA